MALQPCFKPHFILQRFYFVDDSSGDKKRQKRGGRGNIKSKQKKEPDLIRIARIPRGKRKYVTRVTGLATYGNLNLKNVLKNILVII